VHGGGYSDLGFARVDGDRAERIWDAEVVYGAGKTVEQGVGLVAVPAPAVLRLLAETGAVGKTALDRGAGEVHVHGKPIRSKLGRLPGRVVDVSAEYEDVRAAAALDLPVKEVLRAATAAACESAAR
jgi:uncharacterized protein (DUF111 family)